MFAAFVFEIREKTDDGGACAELGEAGEEDGGVDEHTGEADFLLGQIPCNNEKGGDKPDGDAKIVDNCASNALFNDNAHNGLSDGQTREHLLAGELFFRDFQFLTDLDGVFVGEFVEIRKVVGGGAVTSCNRG